MKNLSVILFALALFSGQACALTWTGFFIDYNEQWLRDDAYNRVMTQAKKDMEPSKPSPKKSGPIVKADLLWTGPQLMLDGYYMDDEGIEDLLDRLPDEQNFPMRKTFTRIISSFNDNVEKLYGVPKENVATSMVALLAGGYAAYYNKPFPEKYIKPTYEQLGAYLRKKPEMFEGKSAEMLRSYQKNVGVGMLLQLLQQEVQKSGKPSDVVELKRAGAQVYRAVLNTEPDRVNFTSSGIEFR